MGERDRERWDGGVGDRRAPSSLQPEIWTGSVKIVLRGLHTGEKLRTQAASQPESLKVANTVWGTFSIYGEHFGPKFTLFCRICSFVVNHSPLTVF